jgi:hypothetical protein
VIDLSKAIQDLYAEKERLQRVIASLIEFTERGRRGDPANAEEIGKRPGRKSMSDEERQTSPSE